MSEYWNKIPIQDVVERIETCDPRKAPCAPFSYIDVSSVSRATFSVVETTSVVGSEAPSRARRLVREGDVIFATVRPTLKRIAQITPELDGAVCSTGFFVLRPKNIVLSRYLFYWLLGKNFSDAMRKLQRGASYPAVSDNDVRKQIVALPPLPEQKRIVAILDEAFAGIDAAIANTDKNLANAQELFESYLHSVYEQQDVDWKQFRLKDVCSDYGRGKSKHRPRNDPKLYGGVYPFIQTGDVRHSDHLIKNYSATYNETGLAQSKLWPRGTICITIAANIAETGVLDFDACFPDSIIGLVVDQNIASNAYVEFLLQSVRSILKAKGKGSAQDNINLATFENEYFPFPSLPEQRRIVENIQELRKSIRGLEDIYQQKLAALTELKQSLLQKAFSGELTADNVVEIKPEEQSKASPETNSPEFAAHIMAAAYHWHESQSRSKTFGRVKAQKILHLVESLADIDLGRQPIKDAAGPNDSSHMRAAESWARDHEFFEFVQRPSGQRGYDFRKGARFGELVADAMGVLEPYKTVLDRVVDLLMPLKTIETEILATVYAAWNNLMLEGIEPADAAIIHEARENWHPEKRKYTEEQFLNAIHKLRNNGVVPTGRGKRVTGQESFAL